MREDGRLVEQRAQVRTAAASGEHYRSLFHGVADMLFNALKLPLRR